MTTLQGPARPGRVRSRPCILFFLAITSLLPSPAAAKCHLFSVWHYPKPQRCFTALAPEPRMTIHLRPLPPERIRDEPKRIGIPLPQLDDITWGTTGPDELRAIALLRELYNAR